MTLMIGTVVKTTRMSSGSGGGGCGRVDAGDDVVIVGSGISGLTAAVTAAEAGLSPLVVEAADAWGGSSAMSAGGCGCRSTT
jgi:NADPH-dependent 2,4-dienoyl-CoA reductase/sulfur reductase-like enzyme